MQWLVSHPYEVRREFLARLNEVCADELTLIRETEMVKFAGKRYVQRCFNFATEYLAVIEWNHTERSVRVHECYKLDPPPQAA